MLRLCLASLICYALAMLSSGSVLAESRPQFKIMTEELRPFGYTENGALKGVCVELVREMLKELGHPDDILVYPWDRAYEEVIHEPNRILFAMGRNEARENLFKWVGPLISNTTYLFKLRSSALSIASLDDARTTQSIAVRENYFAHTLLQQLGFENLFLTRDETVDVRMLMAGRADLIAVGELSLQELCKAEELDCSQIENTGVQVFDSKLYLAFSRQTPDVEISRWQEILDRLRTSDRYRDIVRRYLPDSSSQRHTTDTFVLAGLVTEQ